MDDGTGDVWSQAMARGLTEPQPGERVNADLVSTKADHTSNKVVATAKYTDLVRNTDSFQYAMLLKTDEHKKFWIYAGASPDDRNGSMYLGRTNGNEVTCGDKDFAVSYAKDKISFSIPRSCLGKPSWVKYESAGIVYDESNNYFIDDAASDQAQPSQWSAKLHRN